MSRPSIFFPALPFLRRLVRLLALSVLASATLWPQVGTETKIKTPSLDPYPVEWPPGPLKSSVPAWAQPGRIRFSRWDGGPIEVSKAFLSGWPGFNPPVPEYLYVMNNWYDPSTIRLLRDAGINLIWVTFSNGFSIPSEQVQRESLALYIDECHKQGIRVMAYHSVGNMFWEDMYEHVPESRGWTAMGTDGKPVPYGAGDYTKMGRVTRYMARLSHPGWRDYLKKRIDLAIDAGADGIMYDNCFGEALVDTFREIYQHAASKKKDFLIMANFHKREFILNRLINAITTEEGAEAGLFTKDNIQRTGNRWRRELPTMLPLEGAYLANNIGRFRIFDNLSEGWKPVMIESRIREVGTAETHVMSAERHQLVMAENMMFNVATELFVEGAFAYRLWNRDPATVAIWRAIGQYNRFFADHEEFYVGASSQAHLAVVLDNRSEGEEVLNGLAGRNVLYHVLYEHELTPARLKPYAAVLTFAVNEVRPRAWTALDGYASGGGKLLVAEKFPVIDELAKALKSAQPAPTVRVEAPPGLLYNVTEQSKAGRLMVHLVNYLPRPTGMFRVSVRGAYAGARLLSPDTPRGPARIVRSSPAALEIEVPPVRIYSLLVLEKGPGGTLR